MKKAGVPHSNPSQPWICFQQWLPGVSLTNMYHTSVPWSFNFRYNRLSSYSATVGFDSPYPVHVRLVFQDIPRLSWPSLSSALNGDRSTGDTRAFLLKSLEASAFVHLGVLSLTARSLGICRRGRTERPGGKMEAEWSQSPQLNPAFLLQLLLDFSPGERPSGRPAEEPSIQVSQRTEDQGLIWELVTAVEGFSGGSDGKEPACQWRHGLISGSGRFPLGEGNGNPLQ